MHFAVVPHATNGKWELDAYVPPPYHMAVEVDGRQFHSRSEDAADDRARERDLQSEGILVVRVWSDDLRNPQSLAKVRKHIVVRIFQARGIQHAAKGAGKILGQLRERVSAK